MGIDIIGELEHPRRTPSRASVIPFIASTLVRKISSSTVTQFGGAEHR